MKCVVNIAAALVCGLAYSCASAAAAEGEQARDPKPTSAAKPAVQEAAGIDRGSKTAMVIVARDKATWDTALEATGKQQMLPIGMSKGQDLTSLGTIDFGKQMLVAVFWGQMSFSGHGEKCRIERATVEHGELVVDCRGTLWGGAADASYRAWPYHALVVDRSELPVRFRQTTEWKAVPGRTEKDKTLAIVPTTEWKRELSAGK